MKQPVMKHPQLLLALALCVAGQDVRAATVDRLRTLNAPGDCQSALPVFDGNIRKRPKAMLRHATLQPSMS